MAIRNPLQEQLLKAGLAKKSKVDQAARELAKQRTAKATAAPAQPSDAERARLEKFERDRALAAERNAQARAAELRAQVRQIIEQSRLKPEGEIDYGSGNLHAGSVAPVLRTLAGHVWTYDTADDELHRDGVATWSGTAG